MAQVLGKRVEKLTFAQSGVNGEPSPRMEPAASDGSDEYKEGLLYSRQPPPESTFSKNLLAVLPNGGPSPWKS